MDGGNVVGEAVYLSQKQQEFNKRSIRSIKNMFGQSESSVFPRSAAQQSMYAKRILRIAVAQTAIALSQAMDSSEPNTQPLEQLVDSHVSTGAFGYPSAFILCFAMFATLVIAVCSICFMSLSPRILMMTRVSASLQDELVTWLVVLKKQVIQNFGKVYITMIT